MDKKIIVYIYNENTVKNIYVGSVYRCLQILVRLLFQGNLYRGPWNQKVWKKRNLLFILVHWSLFKIIKIIVKAPLFF